MRSLPPLDQRRADERSAATRLRHDWTVEEAVGDLARPFCDLLHVAQATHRRSLRPDVGKTAGCTHHGAYHGAYHAQSSYYDTELSPEPLLSLGQIVEAAALCPDDDAASTFLEDRLPTTRNPAEYDDPMVLSRLDTGLRTRSRLR